LGAIDEIAPDARAAVAGADLVVIAVPVRQIAGVLADIVPHLEPGCVVTDAGSAKVDVVRTARSGLQERFARFVPGHPIAGAERSGVEAASPGLFRERLVVLTPVSETAPEALLQVARMWVACGARIVHMAPQRHDEVFAAVSHLPHALAFALVEMIAARADAEQLFAFAGAGFRDFTRIASSSPEMWRDICLANRDALLHELDQYGDQLARFAAHLQAGDGASL
jgi:prephenate dehydrogenase